MVDTSNLPRINELYNERNQIDRALKMFDNGGRIISLTLGIQSKTDPSFWEFTESVATDKMIYPAVMIDTIKADLENRQTEISDDLKNLGVTVIGGDRRGIRS